MRSPTETDVAFLARVVEHIAHPMFVKDQDNTYVLVNRALAKLSGVPAAAMLGRTDFDLFERERAESYRRDDEAARTTGEVVSVEEPLVDGLGRNRLLATTKVPMHDAAGRCTHIVGIIHDITPHKDVEAALRATNDELERRVAERSRALDAAQGEVLRRERLAVLGRVAGSLAHEIRNPLGAITNAAFVLRRVLRGHPDSDVGAAIDIILQEAGRANRIITDLLDYARIRPPSARYVSVAELVGGARRLATLPPNVALELDFGAVGEVYVDVEQVRTALDHLVDNAVEAMQDGGGTLTLAAVERGDDAVALAVSDTGPGVDVRVADRLFEPLITTKSLGLGLGLTTARALLENQGGTLALGSMERLGATFVVTFPKLPRHDDSPR